MGKIYKGEIQRLLPIFQAMAEGWTIQTKNGNGWIDIDGDEDGLNLDSLIDYQDCFRIKPEPKYRPFENGKECLKEMKKHEPFGWVKSEVFDYTGAISSVSNELGNLCVCNSYVTFKEGFNNYTFFDDTPFGVNEEE